MKWLKPKQFRALPIEVKAAGNVAGGSISRFCKDYGIDKAVRFSLPGFKDQGWLTIIPLYGMKALHA